MKTLGIRQLAYRLNLKTGPQAKDPEERNYHHEGHVTIDQGPGYIKKKLLIEMVNHHIVVHGDKDADGLDGSRKYLLSREGAPIIVEHKGNETILMGGLAETTPTSASKPERELSFQGNSSIWPNSQNQRLW